LSLLDEFIFVCCRLTQLQYNGWWKYLPQYGIQDVAPSGEYSTVDKSLQFKCGFYYHATLC